jgi:hypothetical protein
MIHQYYYLAVSIKVYDRVSVLQCLESSPSELGVWSQFCELLMILNGGKVTQAMMLDVGSDWCCTQLQAEL